ncbi:unnamed protein product [Medioppia subpectinata]|uniref:Vacuolar protein sorting-associated protein 72 homolog n=1 Tax=Medioppia subpectinata TaxID=1979941 RepID=A0A7R9PTK1_9ACAR|nr:unnamed protein product [Medioppia subpectinata]CAG2100520.1 unnamed protein product [Medioppia subpectinata]
MTQLVVNNIVINVLLCFVNKCHNNYCPLLCPLSSVTMSLSTNRIRRPNAGSKMCQLLDTEEVVVDHFYDDIYGGFQEDDNDIDYTTDNETTDGEDIVDSDFSIDENDEPISDDQNDEDLKRKTKRKQTYALVTNKRPKRMKPKITTESNAKEANELRVPVVIDIPDFGSIVSTQSLRTAKSDDLIEKMFEKRFKQNNGPKTRFRQKCKPKVMKSKPKPKPKSKGKSCAKEWTQSELLKEAMITEKLNLQSLREYERLELERNKRPKTKKHTINGPFIRFNSVSMPLIEELDDQRSDGSISHNNHKSGAKTYSRTFITFSDDQTFGSLAKSLANSSLKTLKRPVCPVTQLPARYFDPISRLPFANTEAFNVIRDQYYKQLEVYGNVNQTEVKQWINWRQESGDKWRQWEKQYNSYETDLEMSPLLESQTNQRQFLSPNVESIPNAIHTSRKRKK